MTKDELKEQIEKFTSSSYNELTRLKALIYLHKHAHEVERELKEDMEHARKKHIMKSFAETFAES